MFAQVGRNSKSEIKWEYSLDLVPALINGIEIPFTPFQQTLPEYVQRKLEKALHGSPHIHLIDFTSLDLSIARINKFFLFLNI